MMSDGIPDPKMVDARASSPFRIRLPRLIREEEIGLGDLVKRVAYSIGAKPCGGCEQRAAALNRWVVFRR